MSNPETEILRQPMFKTPVYLGPFDPNKEGGYNTMNQTGLFGAVWQSKRDNNTTAPAVWDGGEIITPNTTDWEQVSGDYEAWLLNKDKPATTGTTGDYPYNGMGRVRLKKHMVNGHNLLYQDDFYKGEVGSRVPNTNTVFEVPYEFELAEDITIPANCVLEFDGGSLSGNHTLIGNSTQIIASRKVIFHDVSIDGEWEIDTIYAEWFNLDYTQGSDNTYKLTQVFNLSSDNVNNIIEFPKKDIYVSFHGTLVPEELWVLSVKSNTTIKLLGSIILNSTDSGTYYIFDIKGKTNVTISGGGNIIGDLTSHSGDSGEYGFGIRIDNSTFINVYDITIKDCWGDGIYIGGSGSSTLGDTTNASKFVSVNNIKIDRVRRNGISITFADGCCIKDCIITNTGTLNGTNPQAAIDIEPNHLPSWNQVCKNITIDNLITEGNVNYSILCAAQIYPDTFENISILNCNCQEQLAIMASNIKIDNCSLSHLYFSVSGDTAEGTVIKNIGISNTTISDKVLFYNKGYKDIIFDNCSIYASTLDPESNLNFVFSSYSSNITFENIRVKNSVISVPESLAVNFCRSIFNGGVTIENSTLDFAGKNIDFRYAWIIGCTIYCNNIAIANISTECVDWEHTYRFVRNIINPSDDTCFSININNTHASDQNIYAAYISDNTINYARSSDGYIYLNRDFVCHLYINDKMTRNNYKKRLDTNGFNILSSTNKEINITLTEQSCNDTYGSTRPTKNLYPGFMFFDETLAPKRPIYWNGTAWVDATGATV